MGNVDGIPVVSQAKSLVQVIGGDAEGAERTQQNFIRQAPVVSQVTSAVQAISGDMDGARRTQEQFGQGMSDLADGIPVVGHIKGGIHYACGDTAGGDNAMRSATRTAGVVGGAVVGGPAGAIAGGLAVDGALTGIESAINNEYRPSGFIGSVTNNINNPSDPGAWFDTVAIPVMDGVGGRSGGKVKAKAKSTRNNKRVYRTMTKNDANHAVQNQQLRPGYNQRGPMSETCISENVSHQRSYLRDRNQQGRNFNPPTSFETTQINVNKRWYNDMKQNNLIPQRGSRRINNQRVRRGQQPHNVYTQERLAGTNDVNVNIKGPHNLNEFNQNVNRIKTINPNSWKYKNKATRRVARYGKHGGFGGAVVASNKRTRTNCPGYHGLRYFKTTHEYFSCDGCKRKMRRNSSMYGCRSCNYDLCRRCYGH